MALADFKPEFLDAYGFFRTRGVPAKDATLAAAREVVRRENPDLRVRWEPDSEPAWYDEELEAVISRRLESGRYTAWGAILERRHTCSVCSHEEWEHVDSLWGIIVDENESTEDQRREYELQLDF